MNDCLNELMRDRLPLLAHGALDAAEAASVRAHVAACASCRAELKAVEVSRVFLLATAPRVDVAAIVAALPSPRLRVVAGGAPARRPFGLRMPRQYLAAAASLLIVASLASPILTRGFRDTPPVGTPDTSLAPTVSDPVTPTPPVVAVATGLSVDGGFADLSDDALTMLLAELEALEGTVAAEPTTLRKPIVETPEGF